MCLTHFCEVRIGSVILAAKRAFHPASALLYFLPIVSSEVLYGFDKIVAATFSALNIAATVRGPARAREAVRVAVRSVGRRDRLVEAVDEGKGRHELDWALHAA